MELAKRLAAFDSASAPSQESRVGCAFTGVKNVNLDVMVYGKLL
jgi:hypothetical protein